MRRVSRELRDQGHPHPIGSSRGRSTRGEGWHKVSVAAGRLRGLSKLDNSSNCAITELLLRAAREGFPVHIWFAGLEGAELHLERVRQRVTRGGHDIPEATVRERYVRGRENLIRLLPDLVSVRVYDNSAEADPSAGARPGPVLLVEMQRGRIVRPANLRSLLVATPDWAKPIAGAALKLHVQAASRA